MKEGTPQEETKYLETESLGDFGYFRVHNSCDLKTFAELESEANLEITNYLKQVRVLTGKKKEDIPLVLDLPARPEKDVSFEEMGLSLAELAGAATAVKLFTTRDSVFFGRTYLGRFARRWFDTLIIKNAPPSEADNWIVKARGEKALKRVDKKPSVAFRTSESLFVEFGISGNFARRADFFEIELGDNIKIIIGDETKVLSRKSQINRRSLHLLTGFCKLFYLYTVTRASITPYFYLHAKPLLPFSDLDGAVSAEDIVRIDRIKSYILQ